jgi:hypothetical protein
MLSVKGSLYRHRLWWDKSTSSSYIKGVINTGYCLPLLQLPQPEHLKNNRSALDNVSFVDEEITRLLATGVIELVPYTPTVVNALTVAQNAVGKKRLVLDLRQINKLLLVPKYKYEDIKTASQYFKRQCYMGVFDLSSGYHHVDVNIAYKQYMCFTANQMQLLFTVFCNVHYHYSLFCISHVTKVTGHVLAYR